MQHLDPERLTLLALGELTATAADADHLAGCADCREELTATRTVAAIGRSTDQLRDLPVPAPALWDRIAAEALPSSTSTSTSTSASASPRSSAVLSEPAAATTDAEPVGPRRRAERPDRRPGRRRGRRPNRSGRWRVALIAAASLLLGVGGTGAVTWLTDRQDQRVIAQAELVAQAAAPAGAHGSASIVDTGHGLQLRVTVTGMPAPAGYYTVWIYDGRSVMIPLGSPGSAPLNLPAAADDLDVFRIVDVSAQDLGQQQHGRSVLQGTLHR